MAKCLFLLCLLLLSPNMIIWFRRRYAWSFQLQIGKRIEDKESMELLCQYLAARSKKSKSNVDWNILTRTRCPSVLVSRSKGIFIFILYKKSGALFRALNTFQLEKSFEFRIITHLGSVKICRTTRLSQKKRYKVSLALLDTTVEAMVDLWVEGPYSLWKRHLRCKQTAEGL